MQKGLGVLNAVAAAGRPLSLPELTETLLLPKQTVHRVVRQLEDDGYLRRDPVRDRYVVGPSLAVLASATLNAAFHGAPVHAILEEVVSEIRETCNIGALQGSDVVYLDRVECDWPLRLQFTAGSHVPYHCTAIGKLLVANLSARARRRLLESVPLQRYTDTTLSDPVAFEAACREIRRQDFAMNNEEYHVGLIGLAVPIRLSDGKVVAALAVHAPAPRMDAERALKYRPRLREAADRIADLMYRAVGEADLD